MATRYNSVQDTNLLTSLGGAVTASDDIFLDKWSLAYAAGSDISGVSITSLTIQPECQCTLTGTGELQMLATTGTLIVGGQGERVEVRSIGPTSVIQTVIVRPVLASAFVQLRQMQVTTLCVVSGVVFGTDTLNAATVNIWGGRLVLQAGATYPVSTAINVWGGSLQCFKDFPDLTMYGGDAELADVAVTPSGAVTVNGGKLTISACGSIATLNAYAGVIDWSRNSRAFTITTMNERPGCTIVKRRGGVEPTVTTTNRPYGPCKVVYVD